MSEKPILFSGPMVRAILDGAKTQTRRLVKLPPDFNRVRMAGGAEAARGCAIAYRVEPWGDEVDGTVIKPLCGVGDTLWVKETWRLPDEVDHLSPSAVGDRLASRSFAGNRQTIAPIFYEADRSVTSVWEPWCRAGGCVSGKTRVSIHMPRWASRLTLRVTDVRVEQLGDICEADCVAEGAVHAFAAANPSEPTWHPLRCWPWLWCQVHGPDAWERDRLRWAWVYNFEVRE